MKVTFGDKMVINAPVDVTTKFLADVSKVGACIPDSQNFVKVDDSNFTMDVQVGVAFIKGIFSMKGSIAENTGSHMAYHIEGSGIGSSVKIVLSLDIAQKDAGSTEVTWNAESDLNGIVSGVNQSVLRKISEDKIDEIIANVKSSIENGNLSK